MKIVTVVGARSLFIKRVAAKTVTRANRHPSLYGGDGAAATRITQLLAAGASHTTTNTGTRP
jgi:hypothetical protein